jgi:hypothetical protein
MLRRLQNTRLTTMGARAILLGMDDQSVGASKQRFEQGERPSLTLAQILKMQDLQPWDNGTRTNNEEARLQQHSTELQRC